MALSKRRPSVKSGKMKSSRKSASTDPVDDPIESQADALDTASEASGDSDAQAVSEQDAASETDVPVDSDAPIPNGRVDIENSVFIEIAHREVLDIPDIVDVRGGPMENVFNKRSGVRLGSNVNSQNLQLSLRLSVKYGAFIPELADGIRRRVADSIYHITGRIVDRIDIYVDHILFKSDETIPVVSEKEYVDVEEPDDDEAREEGHIDF